MQVEYQCGKKKAGQDELAGSCKQPACLVGVCVHVA
jgi:hypothetical protein